MTTQVPPEEQVALQHHAEDVLIVEKLLGWKRAGDPDVPLWLKPATETRREEQWYTPSFTTWAEAGLILEALGHELELTKIHPCGGRWAFSIGAMTRFDTSGPLAIRAAALEYIRRQA